MRIKDELLNKIGDEYLEYSQEVKHRFTFEEYLKERLKTIDKEETIH
ncbi:MAG TPA: hypothetical protein P5136_02675 [Methanofastidiosum sp.]|nr:hypothetical protein [Methanofastidiosum sp.]